MGENPVVGAATGLAGGVVAKAIAPVVGPLLGKALSAAKSKLGGPAEGALNGLRNLFKGACGANSFAAGTAVLMTDGSTKPIQDVKVGDKITNADPDGVTSQQHTVTAVHITDTDIDFASLSLATASGPKTITVTAHRLFWDSTKHTWTNAADLKPGDQLDTGGNGTATVLSSWRFTSSMRTYNLTVDSLHTYYIMAGITPVLVHNTGPCDLATSIADHSIARLKAGASDHFVAGIEGRQTLAQYVDDILFEVRPSISKPLRDGRVAYWDEEKGAVVIENPLAGELGHEDQELWTAFTPKNGRDYYDGLR